ncbi:MAG: restriction endonuclease subunit S [Oenococcus oeni]
METRTVKLGDLSSDLKGQYGINASAVPLRTTLPTYLRITDIDDFGRIKHDGLCSVETDELNKYSLREGDLVFARTGNSTGRNYWYDSHDGNFVFAGFLIRFHFEETEELVPRFLKYYVQSTEYYDWIEGFSTGSTRKNLNARDYGNLPVVLPPKAYQQKVVAILDMIENKILLNQQINKNLLKLIDNIYLRKYFTNSQVISASHVTLANLVNTKTKTFNPKKTSETLVNHFSMPAFDKDHYPVADKVTSIKSNKNIVDPFSVLVSKMNPQVKRVWLPNVSDKVLNVASTEFLNFNADSAKMQAFIYAVVNNKSYQQFLISNATGSTNSRQRVLPRVAYSFQIAFNKTSAEMLGELLVPFLKKIKLIKYENQKLNKLRILLLPKLLSGSIDLSGIEEVIKDA